MLGDRIARFDDLVRGNLSLLPIEGADLVMDPGTRIDTTGRLLPWTIERAGHLLVAQQPDGEGRGLGVHSFDLSAPGTPALEASAFVEAESSSPAYTAIGHTESSVLAQRSGGSYDIIDIRTPGAPRVAARFDLPAGMDGFGRFPSLASLDTAWGWQQQGALIVTGDILASQHTEPGAGGTRSIYLDRLDVSAPDAPVLLPKINIPGELLAFDAATGAIATLDTYRFEERVEDCEAAGFGGVYDLDIKACKLYRRGLSALVLDGDQAVRTSQILLDTDRRTVALALGGADIYYVTEPRLSPDDLGDALDLFRDNSGLPVSLEHVRLGPDGFQRLPSIDLTGLLTTLPRTWQLLAREGRVYAISGQELATIDTRNDTPTITQRTLPTWGCPTLDVRGNTAYCARDDAGLEAIDLTGP